MGVEAAGAARCGKEVWERVRTQSRKCVWSITRGWHIHLLAGADAREALRQPLEFVEQDHFSIDRVVE